MKVWERRQSVPGPDAVSCTEDLGQGGHWVSLDQEGPELPAWRLAWFARLLSNIAAQHWHGPWRAYGIQGTVTPSCSHSAPQLGGRQGPRSCRRNLSLREVKWLAQYHTGRHHRPGIHTEVIYSLSRFVLFLLLLTQAKLSGAWLYLWIGFHGGQGDSRSTSYTRDPEWI